MTKFHIDPVTQAEYRMDDLLRRSEAIQDQIEDLQGLRDIVLEPVQDSYFTLSDRQKARLTDLRNRKYSSPSQS